MADVDDTATRAERERTQKRNAWRRWAAEQEQGGICCKTCGALFCRIPGQYNRGFCSEWCHAYARQRTVKRLRKIAKAKRRALERGLKADSVDPLKVFKRDRWCCHICGKKAPESLRGTYHDLAPELDHVVPLAAGGTHTWGNVKLAHRMCNQVKGATPLGQLMIEGFASV